jgi:hypothetical protein
LGKGSGLACIGEAHLDAHLRKGMRKQIVGAAIELAGRADIVARFRYRLDCIGDGRHA